MDNKSNFTQQKHNYYFASKYSYVGAYDEDTVIRLIQYNEQSVSKADVKTSVPSFKELIKEDCISWFQVKGFKDVDAISRLMKEFGLNNLDIRDVLTPNHIVKIDNDSNHILLIMNSCSFNAKNKISSDHIGLIVVGNVVISLVESGKPLFSYVESALKENIMRLRTRPSGLLLGFLINAILAELIQTSVKVESLLEEMEDDLLARLDDQKHIGAKIQRCRHAYLILRKNTRPLWSEFPKLLQQKEGVIDESMIPMYEELSDQLEYVIQTVENSKEILSSLVDLYVSNNDLKMNVIMKRLTVVSTLFIPITFLVGLWGMNFAIMPETDWKYGYLFAWVIILITGLCTWLFMKRKKWL